MLLKRNFRLLWVNQMWKNQPIERFIEEERAIVSKLQEQRVTP
jgi:hypothetical protein